MRVLPFVMCFLFSAPIILSQTATVPILVVETRSVLVNETQQFTITLKNGSDKAIVGYVMRITRLSNEGKELDSLGVGGLSYDIRSERKKPGDTWDLMVPATTSNVPREIAADVKVELDFALFADGKATGADTFGRGLMLRGELDGVLGERARLRAILRREGIDRLVGALEAPEWERGRAN